MDRPIPYRRLLRSNNENRNAWSEKVKDLFLQHRNVSMFSFYHILGQFNENEKDRKLRVIFNSSPVVVTLDKAWSNP